MRFLALPAVILVYTLNLMSVPTAFVAIVGGHLLPCVCINRSRLYGVLAGTVTVAPLLMVAILYVTSIVGAAAVRCALTMHGQIETPVCRCHGADPVALGV